MAITGYERESLILDMAKRYVKEEFMTLRKLEKEYGVSKSAINNMFNKELYYLRPSLYYDVKDKANINYEAKAKRGGYTTKTRNEIIRANKNKK